MKPWLLHINTIICAIIGMLPYHALCQEPILNVLAEAESSDETDSQADETWDFSDEPLSLEPIETVDSREPGNTDHFDQRLMHGTAVNMQEACVGHELSQMLSSVVSSHVTDYGSRLQRKGIAFRGASPQDVVVRYEGIVINALSSASADLSMIPASLLKTAEIFGSGASSVSGASGGLVELHGDFSEGLRAVLTGGTLKDFDLFVSGGVKSARGKVSGAAFGDYSLGQFSYIDAQGSPQIRQHNAAHRVGGQIRAEIDAQTGHFSGLTFFSAISRQEAGVSEYPARYAHATQDHWLSLSRMNMAFFPVSLGAATAFFSADVSHRASRDIYDNPTAFIGGSKTHSDYLENRTLVSADASFLIGQWSQTYIGFTYDIQHVSASHWIMGAAHDQSHWRNFVAVSLGEQMTFWDDVFQANLQFKLETDFETRPIFEASLGLIWTALDWLKIWGSASLSERRPSFDELYYETEYMRGNPKLHNQRGVLGELGFSVYPAAWLDFKFSGFYHLHTDLIRFIPITPYLYQARNITHAHSRGLEMRLRSAFWRGFALECRYAWVNAVTESGFMMPTTPEHHVYGSLSWDDTVWHVMLSADYTTKIPRNMTETSFSDPKFRLHFELGFKFYRGWRIDFILNNLLDDRRAQDTLQRPLPGRHAFITLQYQPSP